MLPTLNVFGLTIPMYGVMTAVGMLAAFLLLLKTSKYVRFTEDQILSAALWAIITGFLGAKILYWLVEIKQVIANPHYLLETLREGFVFYGALIGGLGGVAIYAAKHKLPYLAFVDLFSPSLVLAHAFGRIGCFFAGCCYGMEYDCAISVVFPQGAVAPAGVPLLPTQLMESAFLFLLTFVLVRLLKKEKTFGVVTSWYMILYGAWRFTIEFFRNDERGFVGALSTSQFISIFAVAVGILLLILVTKKVIQSPPIPEPAEEEKPKKEKKEKISKPGKEE
ncbi:Prolipoprotein diacylglyceryl transferase [bioreactor metagenome]|uniref:Prolipoprotein diacylglyceryl transferase n=1 Tax=bioreactor metagenome TaxID=1076179 RepID=A0A644WTI2_9ZZZZ